MKTKLFTLALLLMSAGSFAQKAFTQATLNEILAEYKTNSKAFFTNRLSDDFRYTTPKGAYQNRTDVVSGNAQKILKVEIAEPVIFQSGDLAVVSGIHKTERTGQDSNPVLGQVACTYTFQKRQGKWMFVASQQTIIQKELVSAGADEARSESPLRRTGTSDVSAIKAVVEGHSQAVLDADTEKAISYFANSPNVAILYKRPDGAYLRGYEDVADTYRKVMAGATRKDEKLTTNDYRYRITGNTAFVTYIETYTKPDGSVSRTTNKANYMEKEGGQWKMVSNFWMEGKKTN